MYANPRTGGGSETPPSCSPYGMSDTAKSTVPSRYMVRPVVEPTAA